MRSLRQAKVMYSSSSCPQEVHLLLRTGTYVDESIIESGVSKVNDWMGQFLAKPHMIPYSCVTVEFFSTIPSTRLDKQS